MLKKCLIANRGEIAVRIIRACRELSIQSVAVYSTADANAFFTQLADEAVWIGEAPPSQSYLNIGKLIQVAQQTGCDCVHPGYGFLSESVEFAQAVMDANLTWVGPSASAIQTMGVKTEARALMQSVDVPVVPGFQSDNASDEEWLAQAEHIGYPIMVKASGGGGGKGIRVVQSAESLLDSIQSAQREAQQAFGDSRIFLEHYIEHGRHIEIQVLADTHGNIVHLFERECSTQRRHQKIVEESPSPLLTDAMRQQMGASAVLATKAVNYVNAGTVEFIVTPNNDYFFLEMNTRLQVEHPVTEMVTGLDLVKLQFLIADGQPLPFTQDDLTQRGHAIECRVYAEDPHNQFLPAIGKVHRFIPPSGNGIRVDSGIQSGDDITIHYDPLIAKLIVYDHDRDSAIDRMINALRETVILGTITNLDFLRLLIDHPIFRKGEVHTRFVDDHFDALLSVSSELDDLVLIVSALHDLQEQVKPTLVVDGTSDRDIYSPWNRTDSFRIR
jgi:3-methylcrotonyl-CoA carboxylase alpha subunit